MTTRLEMQQPEIAEGPRASRVTDTGAGEIQTMTTSGHDEVDSNHRRSTSEVDVQNRSVEVSLLKKTVLKTKKQTHKLEHGM